MRRKLALLALPLFCAGAVGNAQQQHTTELEAVRDTGDVDKTTQTEDVRFRSDPYERMTVPVRVGGNGPYRFLVDTGADRTAVSRELASRLNLQAGSSAALHSISGETLVSTARIPSLQLTRKQINVADAPLLETANIGADGILGVDSLSSQRIVFDFEANTMSLVPASSHNTAQDEGAIVVTARKKNGRLVITEASANDRRATVVLDTGAQMTIGNSALRAQLFGNAPVDPLHRVQMISVTGEALDGEWALVHNLSIGGVTLKDLVVVFADAHAFGTLNLENKPALLLGMNAMRAFKRVSIDFANRKLRVVLPESSDADPRMASAAMPRA
jgi:predicted aspartyl protease